MKNNISNLLYMNNFFALLNCKKAIFTQSIFYTSFRIHIQKF
jgi:hypothetical protein